MDSGNPLSGTESVSNHSSDGLLETLLRRDRIWVLAGIVWATVLAWIYMATLSHEQHGMAGAAGGAHAHHGPASISFLLLFVMWIVMVVAMMLPTASPMILTYASLARRQKSAQGPGVSVFALVLGYLTAWVGFSAIAAWLDVGLQRAAWVSQAGESRSLAFSGGLLVLAGIFQWTPLKTACLSRCRSPLALMLTEWREGTLGAWRMGVRHGLFCVGCCWALMGLMWVAGMLNLLWLAGLTVYMLAEKVLPGADRWGKWTGGGMVLGGLGLWLRALQAPL